MSEFDYKKLFTVELVGNVAYKIYYINGVFVGELVLNEDSTFGWWPDEDLGGCFSYPQLMGIAQWMEKLEKEHD